MQHKISNSTFEGTVLSAALIHSRFRFVNVAQHIIFRMKIVRLFRLNVHNGLNDVEVGKTVSLIERLMEINGSK